MKVQLPRPLPRRLAVLAALTAATLVASVVSGSTAHGVGSGVDLPTPVADVPSTKTPNIADGTVYAITQVGDQIIAGGDFTSVSNRGSTDMLTRTGILAFDQSSGDVSTTFAPTLDGEVDALLPGPIPNTVYAAGTFVNVNGVKSKSITLLDTQTGAVVSGFKPPAFNGVVQSIAMAGGRLYLGGSFTSGGGTHAGIAAINPTTGAIDNFMNVQLAGHHNYDGTGANGRLGPRALAVNPAGTRMMVVGNFTTADGLPRDQAVMIDLDGSSAAVDQNWATTQFTAACYRWAFDTYMTDVQYSADGSYFVITATGGGGTNADGSNSLCDSASRWAANAQGQTVMPTWVDYTGRDSLWSVQITGSAIYVGGHERWMNNPNGSDNARAGAVPRPGIAALDPINGMPLKWNPGRNPRGAGAYALFATSAGLYVGSDTDYFGNFTYQRQKIGFLPLAGGVSTVSTATTSLPANLYEVGQLPNSTNTNVLYRVNAGGPTVAAIDNGPDWIADASDSDPGAQYRNTGSSTSSYNCCATLTSTVPPSTPAAIFNNERWDPGSKNDGNEMRWSFPVATGTHVGVRLYFANRNPSTKRTGNRIFDVSVNGATVLNRYDIVADVGDQRATMREFDVTSTGTITVGFTHEVNNPLIDGIELINLDVPAGGPGLNALAYRSINGSSIGPLTTVPDTSIAWGSTRGAFMLGGSIYYGSTDGQFRRATFDGTTLGTPEALDPYDDPNWDNVDTGSGQTYQGVKPTYFAGMPSVTGAFYSNGRLYYSLSGQSALFWRWFTPDAGVIGGQEFTVGGANFANVAGMVLSGSTLYYANRNDGTLHTIPFTSGIPDGSQDVTISGPNIDGNDWRARSMFLFNPPVPNQPPTASATLSCTGLSCSFDGSGSSDPEGSALTYAWDFGDGSSGIGESPTHGYATDGTYQASLVVTDDAGASSAPYPFDVAVQHVGAAVGFVGTAGSNASTANPSVVVPDGVNPGDTELLYVTAGTVGVTTSAPTGLTGWDQIGHQVNSSMETTVFRRAATAGDAGTTVTVPLSASAKVDLRLAVYSGVSAATPVLAIGTGSNTTTFTTPDISVDAGGSWVVSYWSDRTSNDTVWTLPSGVTSRGTDYGTGGGRVDTALADSGQTVTGGTYAGLTASTGTQSGKGITVAIVLAPAS